VVHACHLSYGLRPDPTRPYPEKPFTKNRAGGVAQGEGHEFKPQYWKKKEKKLQD
jgi:hypothetical protein